MNINDVLALAKAGFTAQQITALSANENQVRTVNQQGNYVDTDNAKSMLNVMYGRNNAQGVNPVQEQLNILSQQMAMLTQMMTGNIGGTQTQPTATQITTNERIQEQFPNTYNAMDDKLNLLSQQVSGLTQTLQLGNIAGNTQPPRQTTEDILASIIEPPENNGGEK